MLVELSALFTKGKMKFGGESGGSAHVAVPPGIFAVPASAEIEPLSEQDAINARKHRIAPARPKSLPMGTPDLHISWTQTPLGSELAQAGLDRSVGRDLQGTVTTSVSLGHALSA